jgi:hypothetical protein
MLRQAQHEIRRALQPELVEGKSSTYFLSLPKVCCELPFALQVLVFFVSPENLVCGIYSATLGSVMLLRNKFRTPVIILANAAIGILTLTYP